MASFREPGRVAARGPRKRCGQDRGAGSLPLEAVSAPTLILHGLADANVPLEDAERAARLVRRAELVGVPDGLHLLALADNASELATRREAFLRHHVDRPRGLST